MSTESEKRDAELQVELDARRALIAARFRQARAAAGLSQETVARALCLARPAVSYIESGKRHLLAEKAALMAALCRVAIAWLLGEPESVGSDGAPALGNAETEPKAG